MLERSINTYGWQYIDSNIGYHVEKVDDAFISYGDVFMLTMVIMLVWHLDGVDL